MRFNPTVPYHPVKSPPSGSTEASVLAFSLAKAGSTLLYDILRRLAPEAGLTFFSIEDELFRQNVSQNRRAGNIGGAFSPTGYCYGGFRQFPAYPVPILHQCRTIFLVRDPRDMAVSLYFSLLKSHALPEDTAGGGARSDFENARATLNATRIDDWVEHDATVQYTRMFEGYVAQGFMWRPNIAIYRYEDVIFNKVAWIKDICDWFDWDIASDVQERVAASVDIVPDDERPDEHIRQVAPGNYRKHLGNRAVGVIEGTLGEYLRLFGYDD